MNRSGSASDEELIKHKDKATLIAYFALKINEDTSIVALIFMLDDNNNYSC